MTENIMGDLKHTTGRAIFRLSFIGVKPTVYATVAEGENISAASNCDGFDKDEDFDLVATVAAFRALQKLVGARLEQLEDQLKRKDEVKDESVTVEPTAQVPDQG